MTWWRRNRWALLALPFVVALAGLAGSYRIWEFYRPYELTRPLEAAHGEQVTVTGEIEDAAGSHPMEATLSVDETLEVLRSDVPDLPEIPGTTVWVTELKVEADPDTILAGCQVRLVDERGRTTGYSTERPGIPVPFSPCVPEDAPGPSVDIGTDFGLDDETPARPASYSVPVIFRTADDFVPERLQVWWTTPEYADLQLQIKDRTAEGRGETDGDDADSTGR